jgi:hypothetical protein
MRIPRLCCESNGTTRLNRSNEIDRVIYWLCIQLSARFFNRKEEFIMSDTIVVIGKPTSPSAPDGVPVTGGNAGGVFRSISLVMMVSWFLLSIMMSLMPRNATKAPSIH